MGVGGIGLIMTPTNCNTRKPPQGGAVSQCSGPLMEPRIELQLVHSDSSVSEKVRQVVTSLIPL